MMQVIRVKFAKHYHFYDLNLQLIDSKKQLTKYSTANQS